MKVEPLVEMKDIRKNFGAVQALKGVDLILHRNEVLGLMGDNAAGKSTLMKVLSGAYVADEGEIFLEGEYVGYQRLHQATACPLRVPEVAVAGSSAVGS
jgi:ABC-type sugar transport system ATPase subunit